MFGTIKLLASLGASMCAERVAKQMVSAIEKPKTLGGKIVYAVGSGAIIFGISALVYKEVNDAFDHIETLADSSDDLNKMKNEIDEAIKNAKESGEAMTEEDVYQIIESYRTDKNKEIIDLIIGIFKEQFKKANKEIENGGECNA